MSKLEEKVADWARNKGISWTLVKTQLVPGDIEAAAEHLKIARANNAPEEANCVLFWMRLLEARASKMQVATTDATDRIQNALDEAA